ncbi:MAG TPA: hypothetical protein VGL82_15525 [Bryobacteraceae bacterium]|jgi:hypothetical protein
MMRRFRNLMICVVLAAASLHNVKMRPDQIEALMEAMRNPKVAHVLQEEHDNGDGSEKRSLPELQGDGAQF